MFDFNSSHKSPTLSHLMKEHQSTNQETRKTVSQIITHWNVQLQQGYYIRFEVVGNQLEVQVLSTTNFVFYYGIFTISNPFTQHEGKSNTVPGQVVEEGIKSRFQKVEFKRDQLYLDYNHEAQIFDIRYTFPRLQKLLLSGDIFDLAKKSEQSEVKLLLAHQKLNEAEKQYKMVFKELKNLQKKVNKEQRELERAEEQEQQKRTCLQKIVMQRINQTMKTFRTILSAIPKVKGETVISFVFLSILLLVLMYQGKS